MLIVDVIKVNSVFQYMSFHQYELLEYIRVLRWGRGGSSLKIRRYYLFGKNIDQNKVVRQKQKNVLLVKGGLPEELDRVIQMLSLLQGGSVNVFPKIKVRKDRQPVSIEQKAMVVVGQLITDEQRSLINNLQRDALAGDSEWLSAYHEHVVVGDSFAHYLAEVRQAVEAQRVGLTKVEVPGMLWVRNTATSVDLVERINTGDTSGIDFGEVIRLKRHVEDIADDDLGDILLPDVDEEVDPVSEEIEIREAISSMISKATDASMEMKKKLKALCLEYWDVFATDHSQTRISKLEPMPVFPLENYEFKYPRARPTSAEKSRFIKEKIMSMEKRKLLKLVPAAEFGSVVFAVPKKGNKLRMVVDLVDVNKILRRDVNQLPFLEKSFENLAQSKFYASFDVVSGFDQLGITEEAKKYFNIVSEHGTYQLNFAPMGYHSTPVFFHQQMVKHVVGREVEGRHEVEGGKWNFNKEYYEKILEVPRPEFVYQLAAILHLAQWLSLAIPKLGELRGKVMAKYPQMKGEKSDLKRKNERVEWSDELSDDFKEFKRILSIAAKQKLQTYDRNQDLLLVTDASKEYHSAIVFQAGSSERSKSLLKKTVFPMMFFSGKFAEDQQRWGIVHKELYPIVKTFSRLSYLLLYHPTPIQVYTDHMNLRAIIKGGSRINHGHLNRLQRWVLTLQQAQVELYHVDGESNIFADMLSRWAARVEGKDREIRAARALVRDPPPESLDTGERNFYRRMFVSPTDQELEQLREMVPGAPEDIKVGSMLDQDSFDTWYLDDDVKYETRQDGGLTFARKPKEKVREEFLLKDVDESAVTFDDILDWVTEQAEYEESSGPTIEDLGTATEDDEILRVTVNAVRLNPNKQREKRTYEQMRAFDKDRVSAFNPYYEGSWKRISEAELLDGQKAEGLGDGMKLARAGDKVVIPETLFERQMVHIHLAGHHGPVSACKDYIEAAAFPRLISRKVGGEVKVIDTDVDTLFKLSKNFRDQLDEYQGRVADYVSLMKSKRNAYWNKRRKRFDKALLQYQVGEWCLISTAKTPRETNKIKLEWSGPVLIQEVLSNNVYRVPDDALRKIFINNWGELEVGRFHGLRYSNGEWWLHVHWKGFESRDDTWEPLRSMYRDVKSLVIKYLENQRKPVRDKRNSNRAMAWIERHILGDINVRWVGKMRPNLRSHLLVEGNWWEEREAVPFYVKNWSELDKFVMRCLVKCFGMGDFESFTKFMPHKSKAMMYSYIQRTMGIMSLAGFNGRKIDIASEDRKQEYNFPVENILCSWKYDSFETAKSLMSFVIPEGAGKAFCRQVERMQSRARQDVSKVRDGLQELTEVKGLWLEISKYVFEGVSFVGNPEGYILDDRKTVTLVETVENVQISSESIETSSDLRIFMQVDNIGNFTLTKLYGNMFDLSGESWPFSVKVCIFPRERTWYFADIYEGDTVASWPGDEVDLLLVDPPWATGTFNPVRGIRTRYPKCKDSEVLDIPFENMKPAFIAIWVIKRNLGRTLQQFDKHQYDLVNIVDWIKCTKSGVLRTSLGYYFQHSAEMLLVFVSRTKKERVLDEIHKLRETELLWADRLENGVKPLKAYEYFESVFGRNALKVELFARCCNLRKDWVQLGFEVDPRSSGVAFGCGMSTNGKEVHLFSDEKGDVYV
eukprot:augustus_masked-scaffold_41-processed-gene-2.21-mRNA-1 protein AED:1.00 eAED:1.00 QI:0/0/0/0/1/1/4/0/1645